jgi:hypothetical protein
MFAIIFAIVFYSQRFASAEPPTATRAEVQIGLCAPADQVVRALDLHPRGASTSVWLFDDTALTLFRRGLRLRLRVAGDRSELTLKVADQDCSRPDARVVPTGRSKCEYDVHGTSMTGAMSLTRELDADRTGELLAGRVAPAQVLAAWQVDYLRDVVGLWPLPPGLRKLGPTQVQSYRSKGGLYDVDISRLPGGTQYVEISRKVPVAEAARAKGMLEADLSRAGVEICADQSAQAVNKLRALQR